MTLGFGEIIPQVVRNGDNVFGFDLTHGTFGISPIDSPGFGKIGESLGLPLSYQQSFERAQWFYWTALALLLFTVFCSVRLRDSRLGRAWIAIREDETAAAAMGVPLMRTKTWSYAIGAFFGGVAGAFYASFKSGAFPADFYFNISVFLLCMVILGGMGSVWGVILGGMILGYLNVEGLATIGLGAATGDAGIDFDPTKYQFGFYGVIIVLMMLFRPEGLIPERRHKRELEARRPRHAALRRHARGLGHRPGSETMTDLLVAEQVRKEFGGLVAVERRRLHDPAGLDRLPDRPQRGRQDDVLQHAHRRLQADRRRIVFDGDDVSDKPPHAITELGVGRTFQNIRLFQHMTALENVLVGMHCRIKGGILGSILAHAAGAPRGARRRRARRGSCSRSPGCPAATTRWRGTSPTATSAGSRSRARSRPSRSCCSSTSRPRG